MQRKGFLIILTILFFFGIEASPLFAQNLSESEKSLENYDTLALAAIPDSVDIIISVYGLDSAEYYCKARRKWIKNMLPGVKKNVYRKSLIAVWAGLIHKNANILLMRGKYNEALKLYFTSIRMNEKIANWRGYLVSLQNIGIVYRRMGSYEKALKYYKKCIQVAKKLGMQNEVADLYHNIGISYMFIGQLNNAVKYLQDAMKYYKDNYRQKEIVICLNNIGLLYSQLNKHHEAQIEMKNALAIAKDMDNPSLQALTYHNLGHVFANMGNFAEANKNNLLSINYKKKLGDMEGMGYSYLNLASNYVRINMLEKAKEYFEKASSLIPVIHNKEFEKKYYEEIQHYYLKRQDYRQAYHSYVRFEQLSDSLSGERLQRKYLEEDIDFEYEKQKALLELSHRKEIEKQKEIASIEQNKKNQILIIISVITVLISAFLFVVYRSRSTIYAQKINLEEKNREIAQKNKEITDSINYAETIQKTLFTGDQLLSKYFPDSFILFMPKDIVSGDFYWAYEQEGKLLVLLGDCTGHGVPGAFTSLLMMTFLHDAVNVEKIKSPHAIFNYLNARVSQALKDKNDGMDASLIEIEVNEKKYLHYVASNQTILILREGKIIPLETDKMPIGKFSVHHSFQSRYVALQPNDVVYMFSDGYADQFGGEKNKKYKTKNLYSFLLSIASFPMQDQMKMLKDEHNRWKGTLEQTDDICMIGIRVS